MVHTKPTAKSVRASLLSLVQHVEHAIKQLLGTNHTKTSTMVISITYLKATPRLYTQNQLSSMRIATRDSILKTNAQFYTNIYI